ncbi:unnamed protein product [Triticum turgidum subsp. durum]|uniref:Disease resistance protein winged helix domain-containing protein n=1 Tax=Triticum turgidum subsp. durum TaxID=4567 RepID=A0A9R0ZSB0_TRITD|nr:unnamed protein product [Triticum turgidum subsp. durum]
MPESSNSEDPNAMGGKNLPYTVLHEHLKSCLLYLSMFRNGYEISVDRLISGWIAEGYIPEHAAGEECLSELIERNLIEAVKIDSDGKALCCLNDKGRELIASFSAEENSVTILKKRQGKSKYPL